MPFLVYIGSTALIIGIILLLMMQNAFPKSLIWFVYTNGNPLVIVSSISLFCIFNEKYFTNKRINYLSGSVLSIYLITDFVFVRQRLNEFLYQKYQSNLIGYILAVILTMSICVCIDQIRKAMFGVVYKGIEKIFK